MTDSTAHDSSRALKLLALLQEMAAQHTNATLEVLGHSEHAETERRYPEDGLLFAGQRWRAFYHCHESTALHPQEHGHFHIFTDSGAQDWAHVTGLSIDAGGQPLQWFAVNRWVTDGPWLQRQELPRLLQDAAAADEADNLVASWLLAMLQLYRDTLIRLLMRRDEQLQASLPEYNQAERLEDRTVYTLATEPIDLQTTLEQHLLQPDTCPGKATGDSLCTVL